MPTLNTTLDTTLVIIETHTEPTLNSTLKPTSLKPKGKTTQKPKITTTPKVLRKTTLKPKTKGKPAKNTTLSPKHIQSTTQTTTEIQPFLYLGPEQNTTVKSKKPIKGMTTIKPRTPTLKPTLPPAPLLTPTLMRLIPTQQNITEYLVVGRDIESEEVPYFVALDFTAKTSSWFCAGTILQHRWILTVASCTTGALRVRISYGASLRSNPEKQVYVGQRSMFKHPKYKKGLIHDIALIQTPYVKFTKRVGPLALSHSITYVKNWIFTGGWGQHNDTRSYKDQLHQIRIQVMERKYCMMRGYGRKFHVGMLCTQLPVLDTSCGIDSGSPLVVQSNCGLIGIASYGSSANCRRNTLLGYTNVQLYYEWMTSIMSKKK